jgi:hypothetical protein
MGNKNIFTYSIYNLQIKTTKFHTINLENEDTQVYQWDEHTQTIVYDDDLPWLTPINDYDDDLPWLTPINRHHRYTSIPIWRKLQWDELYTDYVYFYSL